MVDKPNTLTIISSYEDTVIPNAPDGVGMEASTGENYAEFMDFELPPSFGVDEEGDALTGATILPGLTALFQQYQVIFIFYLANLIQHTIIFEMSLIQM